MAVVIHGDVIGTEISVLDVPKRDAVCARALDCGEMHRTQRIVENDRVRLLRAEQVFVKGTQLIEGALEAERTSTQPLDVVAGAKIDFAYGVALPHRFPCQEGKEVRRMALQQQN